MYVCMYCKDTIHQKICYINYIKNQMNPKNNNNNNENTYILQYIMCKKIKINSKKKVKN